jgi:hypothetical protein
VIKVTVTARKVSTELAILKWDVPCITKEKEELIFLETKPMPTEV